MGGEKRVGFLARIGHSRPACSHVHPMLKEVAFFNTPKIWDCRGCVCGPNFVCGSELWTAAVETEKREEERSLYKVGVIEGQLEEGTVG